MSDNIVAEYDFKFLEGDTYSGFSLRLTNTIDDDLEPTPIDLSGASVQMKIQSSKDTRKKSFTLSTSNKRISIIDAEDGRFQVNRQKIKLPEGLYEYSMQVQFPNGDQITYLIGCCEVIGNSTSKL